MAVLIGHASISENGTVTGIAGDQTGKEVCVREWYDKGWQYVLRCKDYSKAELMAYTCERGCTNPHIGYNQNKRNTLRKQAITCGYELGKITVDCECDCSSFMAVCAECAGIGIPYNGTNAPTTSTMCTAFMSTGKFELLTDAKYLNTDAYLMRGDILVKAGSHTVMVLENGSKVKTNTMLSDRYMYGVDLSANNGSVDFVKVSQSGIKFAVLRVTTKNNAVDGKFGTYLKGCLATGIAPAVYKYSYAVNVDEAIAEAKGVLRALNGQKYAVWLDLEDKSQIGLGKAKIEEIAIAFITELEKAGYTCGIYCNLNWYQNYISDRLKSKYVFWIARYGKNTGLLDEQYKPKVGERAWQYTSKGSVEGINGYVDLDVIYL